MLMYQVMVQISRVMENPPVWAKGLKKCGAYYEGYVEDLETTLELHRCETVTTWGIRRSQTKRCTPVLCATWFINT